MTVLFESLRRLPPFIRNRKIFIRCLVISSLLHLSILLYFYTHPILLSSSLKSLFGLSSAEPEWLEYDQTSKEDAETQLILQQAFDHIVLQPSQFQQPLDHLELPQRVALAPKLESLQAPDLPFEVELMWEEERPAVSAPSTLSPPDHEESPPLALFTHTLDPSQAEASQELPLASTVQPQLELALTDPWEKDEISAEFELFTLEPLENEALLEFNEMAFSPSPRVTFDEIANSLSTLKTSSQLHLAEIDISPLPLKEERLRVSDFYTQVAPDSLKIDPSLPAMPHRIPLDIDHYALPSMATAVEWSDEFDANLQFASLEGRKGYIFSIELQPKLDVSQYSLKQNIHFIIDRSHSVQKHRFAVFKRAILKALTSMQAGDTFNIYIIDKKITKFASSAVRLNKKAIDAAEAFLEQQQSGSLFAESNIYTALDKVLAELSNTPSDVHTAVFLTDGNTLKEPIKQQKELSKWIDKNSGRLSLYTAAVGQKNHSLMLDLLSSVSGGKFLYSDTHASFPRKLAKLMLDLKNPIAKNLMISARPHRNNARVEFYPAAAQLPHLYGHQPYVIYGYIDQPCSFDLILQGKNGENWIAIKKSFSFGKGEKNTPLFEKQWQASQTHLHYTQFIKEGKASHLDNAKAILNSVHREIAYE